MSKFLCSIVKFSIKILFSKSHFVSLYLSISIKPLNLGLTYINIYSLSLGNLFLAWFILTPLLSLILIATQLRKFSLPNISSINTFKYACSLSSHCTVITPLSLSNFFANSSLFFINVSQVEWLNLSLYLKLSFPVLYGGSI